MRLEDEHQQTVASPGAQPPERRTISTGRNLPAALAVGVVLGGLVILTLLTIKGTFLIYVGIVLGDRALGARPRPG